MTSDLHNANPNIQILYETPAGNRGPIWKGILLIIMGSGVIEAWVIFKPAFRPPLFDFQNLGLATFPLGIFLFVAGAIEIWGAAKYRILLTNRELVVEDIWSRRCISVNEIEEAHYHDGDISLNLSTHFFTTQLPHAHFSSVAEIERFVGSVNHAVLLAQKQQTADCPLQDSCVSQAVPDWIHTSSGTQPVSPPGDDPDKGPRKAF